MQPGGAGRVATLPAGALGFDFFEGNGADSDDEDVEGYGADSDDDDDYSYEQNALRDYYGNIPEGEEVEEVADRAALAAVVKQANEGLQKPLTLTEGLADFPVGHLAHGSEVRRVSNTSCKHHANDHRVLNFFLRLPASSYSEYLLAAHVVRCYRNKKLIRCTATVTR